MIQTEKQTLALSDILVYNQIINILINTNQSIDFDSKIVLGSIANSMSIISDIYYKDIEKQSIELKEIVGIKPDEEDQDKIKEFNTTYKEYVDELGKKTYEVEVPLFTKDVLKQWEKDVKDSKTKQFDPPILFFKLIAKYLK